MKKTMFVMLKTLGDVILGTTICRELKRDDPERKIRFYTNKPYDQLLANNPFIDEISESDSWPIDGIFMELAREDWDEAFLPYQVRGECNMWHQTEKHRHQHLVDFYWRRMGMHRKIEERECYLFPSESDFKASEKHISLDVPRVAIHSTTGVSTKDWPGFEELTEILRKAGYAAVQVGARSDKKVEGSIDMRGKMGFLELAAFLSKCAAFVGLDSGLSYMADAMKTPTVVVQGSTNPVTSGPISGRVIHLFAERTGYDDCQIIRCHVNCRHERNCINEITPGMVAEKLSPILEKWNSPIPAGID